MGKAPAFQFYVGDWMQDTRPLSLSAKGAWIDLLCAMWRSQSRGRITLTMVGYARLIGASVEQTKAVIDELTEMQTCDFGTDGNGNVTLINRRMIREQNERELTRLRVGKFRNTHEKRSCNAKVTAPSSSSSSSSCTKVQRMPDADFLSSLQNLECYRGIDVKNELVKMDAWLLANPNRRKTRKFIVNWLNRIGKIVETSSPSIDKTCVVCKEKEGKTSAQIIGRKEGLVCWECYEGIKERRSTK